jgi:hypothetical protein
VHKGFVGTNNIVLVPKYFVGAQNVVLVHKCFVGTQMFCWYQKCAGAQITRSDVSIQIQPYRNLC